MAKRVDCEIINHGPEHSQYFQGQGCSYTRFDYCATGCGDSTHEAYEDACEQVAQSGHNETAAFLPTKPRGIRKDQTLARYAAEEFPGEDLSEEIRWYVSILYNALPEPAR